MKIMCIINLCSRKQAKILSSISYVCVGCIVATYISNMVTMEQDTNAIASKIYIICTYISLSVEPYIGKYVIRLRYRDSIL